MSTTRALSKQEEDALVETTALEVEKGFLQGPYTEEEMSVLMGTDGWSLNPRFVLFQGSNQKVRLIDGAKQSAVNSAYSSTVKLQLQDVDCAAAMVIGAMREVGLSTSDALDWLGKTFDLSKAYKQLAVLPEHQLHAVVGFSRGQVAVLQEHIAPIWVHWQCIWLRAHFSSPLVFAVKTLEGHSIPLFR